MRARPPVRIHRKKKQHEVAPHTRAEDDVRGDGLARASTGRRILYVEEVIFLISTLDPVVLLTTFAAACTGVVFSRI